MSSWSVQSAESTLPEAVAAVDLGSNSFHMIVARIAGGDLQVIDRLKEMVRLGEGLTGDKYLRPEVAPIRLNTRRVGVRRFTVSKPPAFALGAGRV